jgi:hypothetical protein
MPDRTEMRKAVTSFIVELEKLRDESAGLTLKRLRTELKRVMVDRLIATIEANRTIEVVTAKDANDKPMFSNETHRKAQIQCVLDGYDDYQKTLTIRDRLTKMIYRLRCEEEITDTQVKKFESLERLYFIDLENK